MIREYSNNKEVIKFIQKKFKRLSKLGAIKLTRLILQQENHIKVDKIVKDYKGFLHYNRTKFDKKTLMLKTDDLNSIKRELNGFLLELGKSIVEYDEIEHKGLDIKEEGGVRYMVLDKHTVYKDVRKYTCDEGGDIVFRYDFSKTMPVTTPQNVDVLQRCYIQILSTSIKFDYPIEFFYKCTQCKTETNMKAYDTVSTNNRISCEGYRTTISPTGEERIRVCGTKLNPDNEVSTTKDAYYYDISYEDEEGNKHSTGAFSFNKYAPGFYDCVLFRVKNPRKTELYQIIDVKSVGSNKFNIPEKKEDENYIFTMQKSLDNFIKQQTGMEIYGLYPVKVALILQKAITHLGGKLFGNIQLVGGASTGKTTVLKYYGFLLNNHLNLTTNGLSTSVAALRGTRVVVSLMGKEQKIVTTGYLGTYNTIHIDEAGENKELTQNLKTFLLEDDYGYDRAGGTGVFNKRKAQVNISENLDYNHLGQYRGVIRKAYKELNVTIGGEEKVEWNEKWDLHQPIFKYTNPHLHKVINEKRIEYKQKEQWWIDGYDYALHERFPFYFYLVNEKQDDGLSEVIKGNVARDTISENLELIRALKAEEIQTFFDSLKEYKESADDKEHFYKVDKILESYGIIADARIKEFYYNVVRLSRIINQRKEIKEEDFDLLKWIIEKTNCKLDVVDTIDYNIHGPPDLERAKEIEKQIEEDTIKKDEFGLPEGEFI